MPQIPIYAPNRVMDIGSPVPVGSGSHTAGAEQGSALRVAGDAIFNLGVVLQKEHVDKSRELARVESEDAIGKARLLLGQQRAEQMSAAFEQGDKDNGWHRCHCRYSYVWNSTEGL
jgi:hypothetical protein